MKIALCLHGLVGTTDKYGRGSRDISPSVGHKHFRRHVMDTNDEVDTFIHTWSTGWEKPLRELYNPVAMIAEGQPQFPTKAELKEIAKKSMKDPTWTPPTGHSLNRKQAIYCRWKSTQNVLNLLKESGRQYDYILLTRFDVAFLVDFIFKNYNPDKFYAQGPPGLYINGLNHINDLWFFANQENMMKFSSLFDNLEKEEYKLYIDSNHELARQHLIKTGLNEKLEYMFKREWTGSPGKVTSDTPLVRWFYEAFLDQSLIVDKINKKYVGYNLGDLLEKKRDEYAASISPQG
jgi:hypothetical protein